MLSRLTMRWGWGVRDDLAAAYIRGVRSVRYACVRGCRSVRTVEMPAVSSERRRNGWTSFRVVAQTGLSMDPLRRRSAYPFTVYHRRPIADSHFHRRVCATPRWIDGRPSSAVIGRTGNRGYQELSAPFIESGEHALIQFTRHGGATPVVRGAIQCAELLFPEYGREQNQAPVGEGSATDHCNIPLMVCPFANTRLSSMLQRSAPSRATTARA